jgi:hypothetical protein
MIYKNIIDFIKGERLESLIYDLTGRKTIKDFEDYLDDYSDRDIVTLGFKKYWENKWNH